MAKKPCATPGCGVLVERGHCAAHTPKVKPYDRWRGTAASRGYDYAWTKVRDQALKRDAYLCVKHRALGVMVKADEVHHIIAADEWPAGRLLLSNVESLCHEHHVIETWKERHRRQGGSISSSS